MTAPNTIPPKEYAQRLFEASRKVSKQLARLADDEASKSRAADDKGDNEEALKHYFRMQALQMARYAITRTPAELESTKHQPLKRKEMNERLQNIACALINQRINEKERLYNIAAREEIKSNIERLRDAFKKKSDK